jgi:ABC-type branched-subunit amino acid transport system substrate-binding protein
MSDRNRTRRLASLLAVGTLAVGLTACGGDDGGGGGGGGGAAAPGVTDTEVTFGTHQPLTGPAAAGYAVISPATKAYFDYVNAKGGIHGRKLVYKIKDDGYNPANTQKVVRELVLQDKVFAVLNGLGTPTHTGVLDFLKSNRVPDLFVASGSRSWNQPDKYPTTFGYHPDYTVESKIAANHIKTEMPGKKVCALGQDDDFGADALRGLEAVLGKDGLTERQRYVTTNTNLAPQIGKMKAAGCEVVHLATIPGFTALALGTAARIGFQPQWFSTSVGADYRAVAETLGKKGEPLLEGFLATNYLPIVDDTSNPWVKFFKEEVQAKYNAGKPFDGQTLYGMAIGYATAELLQKNGKELTRESIVGTLEKGGLKGAGFVPMNFSKDNHSGYSGARVNVVKDGKQAYFGPTFTTDDGTGPVEEYTGEENTPPTDGVPTR